MFETFDFDFIIDRMLEQVPDKFDKREGSVIWDALAPAAMELSNFYINLDIVTDECFADSASYYYLIKRAAERNLFPKEATKAVLKGEFTPDTIDVPVGTRFNLDDLNYVVISKMTDEPGIYRLECETEGVVGNQQVGNIIPIEYVKNLETARLTEVLIPGDEEEEVEVFRNRYFSSFDSQAFGGNIADYKKKVHALSGIGGVKVYPIWNGGGTVKLTIATSEFKKPTQDLVNTVQNYIDPVGDSGMGVGLAPIGHTVTVFGVLETVIDIETTITYQAGYNFNSLRSAIEDSVNNYFYSLSSTWENEEKIVVRISQIETRLLNITGIVDITGTKLNGSTENLSLDSDAIPVRGEIVG